MRTTGYGPEIPRPSGVAVEVSVAALIVAAGRGLRASPSSEALPKQYLTLGGKTVLARSIEAFARHDAVAHIAVVIHPDDASNYRATMGEANSKLLPPIAGGATRQDSVRLGLEAMVRLAPSHVLI